MRSSKINVRDILNWSIDEVEKKLNDVLEAVTFDIEGEGENSLDILRYVLETFIQTLPTSELGRKLVKIVCDCGENVFVSTLNGLNSLRGVDSIPSTQTTCADFTFNLINLCCEIISYFHSGCENLVNNSGISGEIWVCDFLQVVEKILSEAYSYIMKNQGITNSFQESFCLFVKNTNDLQLKYITLVTVKVDFHSVDDTGQNALLLAVKHLARCSEDALNFDIKLMVENLKAFLKMIDSYKEDLLCVFDAFQLIHCILKFLNDSIDQVLETRKATLNALKVTNFLLKVLIKICSTFKTFLEKSLRSLTSFLFKLYRCTPTYLSSLNLPRETITDIYKLMYIGADPLLMEILTENEFLAAVDVSFREAVMPDPYGCLIFLVTLLKKCRENKLRYSIASNNCNILNCIFESLSHCHFGVLNDELKAPGSSTSVQAYNFVDLYQYVLSDLAVFFLTCPFNQFDQIEECLLENVLQPDPWRAIMACDLWCLMARYGDAELCHGTLDILIPLFDSIGVESHRPEVLYLTWLVSRLLPLCESQYLDGLSTRFPLLAHPRIWRVVGLQHCKPIETKKFLSHYLHMLKDPAGNDFFQVEKALLALESTAYLDISSCENPPCDQILELCKIDISSPLHTAPIIQRYITLIFSCTSFIASASTSEKLIQVFIHLNRFISSSLPMVSLAGIALMQSMSEVTFLEESDQQRLFQTIATFFRHLLTTSNLFVKERALAVFSQFAQLTTYPEIISLTVANNLELQNAVTEYIQKNNKKSGFAINNRKIVDFNHSCCSKPIFQVLNEINDENMAIRPAPKRFKCSEEDVELESNDLNLALKNFQKTAVVISKNSFNLSYEDKVLIRRTCEMLAKL